MRISLLFTAVLCAFSPIASADTIDSFKRLEKTGNQSPNLVRNGDFSEGAKHWQKDIKGPGTVKFGGNYGITGTPGLYVERPAENSSLVVKQTLNLKPYTRYRASAWIKTEGVTGGRVGPLAECWSADGKFGGGAYHNSACGDNEWHKAEYTFVTGDTGVYHYNFGVYMPRNVGGAFWADDLYVGEDLAEWTFGMILPHKARIDTSGGKLEFTSRIIGKFDYPQTGEPDYAVHFTLQNTQGKELQQRLVPLKNNRCTVDFGKLSVGDYRIAAKLVDLQNQYILNEQECPLQVIDRTALIKKAPVGTCEIDGLGRAIVDGKPFFPVGMFVGQLNSDIIDNLAQGGFNAVVSYHFPYTADLASVLDYAQTRNMKYVASVKDTKNSKTLNEKIRSRVEQFKNHPALLAWYTADEPPLEEKDFVLGQRKWVNELDPFHPTWALFNKSDIISYFVGGMDIIGFDNYPTGSSLGPASKQLDDGRSVFGRASDGAMACWMAPLSFNFLNAGYPSGERMLAQGLGCIIDGAKGIFYYAYQDLAERDAPEEFDRRFPEWSLVAKRLRVLGDFILSDDPHGPEVAIKGKKGAGELKAKVFKANDGRLALVIVNYGPGGAEAVIEIASKVTGLKSMTGNTGELGNGKYLFKADQVAGDILLLEQEKIEPFKPRPANQRNLVVNGDLAIPAADGKLPMDWLAAAGNGLIEYDGSSVKIVAEARNKQASIRQMIQAPRGRRYELKFTYKTGNAKPYADIMLTGTGEKYRSVYITEAAPEWTEKSLIFEIPPKAYQSPGDTATIYMQNRSTVPMWYKHVSLRLLP